MSWPHPEAFHYKFCAWMLNALCPCDCGGDEWAKSCEEGSRIYVIENNQREEVAVVHAGER